MKVLKVLTTIATNDSIRSEAVTAVAVMMEKTGLCGPAGARYADKTASGSSHHARRCEPERRVLEEPPMTQHHTKAGIPSHLVLHAAPAVALLGQGATMERAPQADTRHSVLTPEMLLGNVER